MFKRDITVDITKAIGILLMIIGHFNGLPSLVRNCIFSFHMPLFFILSGYFYKPKTLKELFSHGNRHLVKPYLITSVSCIILCLVAGNYDLAKAKIIGTIMSNGGWPHELFGANLPFIGPIWFLLALYWCKVFYAFLKQKTDKCLLYSFIISTIALIIGKYIVNLPFGILTGFCGMVFYGMGDYWKNRMGDGSMKTSLFLASLIIWALCVWKGHLELAAFECSLYPISMYAAFIGTYITYLVAKRVPTFLHSILSWIGQNTLLILCYHTVSTFVILNIRHYLLNPHEVTLGSFSSNALRFFLSLGLPYCHARISNLIKKKNYHVRQ